MEGLPTLEPKVSVERRVSAIITISAADESPEQAVTSVLENQRFFEDLHIVKFGYSSHAHLYNGWDQDLEDLKACGLDPVWHSELDVSKLRSRAAIEIEPDLRVCDGAFCTLFKDMETNTNCDHFGVSSITYIRLEDHKDPRAWIEALTYGFLLVVMMLDSLRSLANLSLYHRSVDLRGRLITTTWPNRVRLAPHRGWVWYTGWFTWWFQSGISTSKHAGAACMQLPSQKDQGFALVLRTIKTHKHMGFGIWLIGYLLYWLLFAWPIWTPFVNPHSRIGMWFARDMTALYWIIPYMLHTVVVGYIAWLYMEFPLRLLPLQVVLYTFYLTASPAIFLYARFHKPRGAWESNSTSHRHRLKGKKE